MFGSIKKAVKRAAGTVVIVAAVAGSATCVHAQTNTISGVTSQLTTGLGSSWDVSIGIGIAITGVLLAVGIIKRGVKARG